MSATELQCSECGAWNAWNDNEICGDCIKPDFSDYDPNAPTSTSGPWESAYRLLLTNLTRAVEPAIEAAEDGMSRERSLKVLEHNVNALLDQIKTEVYDESES